MLIAGIDEAGYGPKLGPLCVGFTAARVSPFDPASPPNLWAPLRPTVGRSKARTASIRVDDSKRLRAPGPEPMRDIEKSARAHLGVLGRVFGDDVGAFEALGSRAPAKDLGPLALTLGDQGARISLAALRERMRKARIEMLAMGVETIHSARFNESWRRTRSKAEVEIEAIAPRIRWVWDRAERGALLSLDRLGGRTHYGPVLERVIPEGVVVPLLREKRRIVYLIAGADREMHVEVLVDGDRKRYMAALASIAAKWIRELTMARFNRVYAAPELKPTLGYGTDAARWIREAREALGREVVDPLVRLA